MNLNQTTGNQSKAAYVFTRNDPHDRLAPIQFVVPSLIQSHEYMRSMRSFSVPADSIAIWFLGQNGFILKDSSGHLIGIDLYLTNSCATTFAHLPVRVDRQLPIFIQPEDLDVDFFVTTHSHQDHADPETSRRLTKNRGMQFIGPYDSMRIYAESGIEPSACQLIHPGQTLELFPNTTLQATFALPTDNSDLNHTGTLLQFDNGIRFFNTGDTAYADRLAALMPDEIDICAICINGGFHNLLPSQAAAIVKALRPKVAIPCHYDMMINNVGSPALFESELEQLQTDVQVQVMRYYEPWIYRKSSAVTP